MDSKPFKLGKRRLTLKVGSQYQCFYSTTWKVFNFPILDFLPTNLYLCSLRLVYSCLRSFALAGIASCLARVRASWPWTVPLPLLSWQPPTDDEGGRAASCGAAGDVAWDSLSLLSPGREIAHRLKFSLSETQQLQSVALLPAELSAVCYITYKLIQLKYFRTPLKL